jgi:unspecific monooxygenase
VDRVWGDDPDPEPAFQQVAKLRYVRRALDEALRLWPTAPAFFREAREDVLLGGRYQMRKGDFVIIPLPLLHRDPTVWGPDPEAFDPDRFAPGRAKERPPHAYKPFGTGERACIGRQFAIHEATLVLGMLLHRYDMRPDPDYKLAVTELLTVKPKGFTLTLRRRNQSAFVSPRSSSVSSAS